MVIRSVFNVTASGPPPLPLCIMCPQFAVQVHGAGRCLPAGLGGGGRGTGQLPVTTARSGVLHGRLTMTAPAAVPLRAVQSSAGVLLGLYVFGLNALLGTSSHACLPCMGECARNTHT